MTTIRTGDLLHSRSSRMFGSIIRLATAPLKTIKGKWVPNHTAIAVQDDGLLWAYESIAFKGAHRVPFTEWVRKHKDYRVTPMPLSGYRCRLKTVLNSYLGTGYERWWSLLLVPFNRAKRTAKRLFCTEYVIVALQKSGFPYAPVCAASTMDPDELYRAY
jgi:hypothetical protein